MLGTEPGSRSGLGLLPLPFGLRALGYGDLSRGFICRGRANSYVRYVSVNHWIVSKTSPLSGGVGERDASPPGFPLPLPLPLPFPTTPRVMND